AQAPLCRVGKLAVRYIQSCILGVVSSLSSKRFSCSIVRNRWKKSRMYSLAYPEDRSNRRTEMTDHTSGPIGHTHRDLNDTTGQNSILSLVREGMDVYDAKNDHIGSVELVRFGATSESGMEHGTGSATPGRADSLR